MVRTTTYYMYIVYGKIFERNVSINIIIWFSYNNIII